MKQVMAKIKNSKVLKTLVHTDRMFVITYFAYLKDELVKEQIITPMQSKQISTYIQDNLQRIRK
jgi:hypothetical protein